MGLSAPCDGTLLARLSWVGAPSTRLDSRVKRNLCVVQAALCWHKGQWRSC